MIRVDRGRVTPPASLARKPTSGAQKGLTEEEAIILEYAVHRSTVPLPTKFDFTFKAYKSDDVKAALHELFGGKCAYCESRYAGTQPMDVEHWRPKGGVEETGADGKKILAEGYPWLAARWSNLLPSCIDCNRSRTQTDLLTGEVVTLGKANQFPVSGPRMLPPEPGDPPSAVEDAALIVDPTVDDPAAHLGFRADGGVVARGPKGEHSIRVYALNRSELAIERLGLARLIEQRLTTIEALAAVIADRRLDPDLRLDLEDLVAHEVDALFELAEPTQQFSAMARQLIAENAPAGLTPAPAAPLWPAQVAAQLQRFDAHDPRPDHVVLASRLAGLGFEPHLPRSRSGGASPAPYVRWTLTGTAHRVTVYQEASGLVIDSAALREVVSSLPRADVSAGVHPKVRFTYREAALDAVLAAATRLREWADDQDA